MNLVWKLSTQRMQNWTCQVGKTFYLILIIRDDNNGDTY